MDPVEFPINGELDLHTFRPSEVHSLVPEYIDECITREIFSLRIIHGKGIGTLRETVHAILRKREDVAAFELAPPNQGGWGTTLVRLKSPQADKSKG